MIDPGGNGVLSVPTGQPGDPGGNGVPGGPGGGNFGSSS